MRPSIIFGEQSRQDQPRDVKKTEKLKKMESKTSAKTKSKVEKDAQPNMHSNAQSDVQSDVGTLGNITHFQKKVTKSGAITIPSVLRNIHGINNKSVYNLTIDEKGVITLKPAAMVCCLCGKITDEEPKMLNGKCYHVSCIDKVLDVTSKIEEKTKAEKTKSKSK